jgi:hypothetical protein
VSLGAQELLGVGLGGNMRIPKTPERGDTVIDYDNLFFQRGEIISGIFDNSDPNAEVMTDAFVKFSHARSQWYPVKELIPNWNPEEKAYVLNLVA